VHQVAVDVEQHGTIGQGGYHVTIPDLFEKCLSHGLFLYSLMKGEISSINGPYNAYRPGASQDREFLASASRG
jgi:hypothetical protein